MDWLEMLSSFGNTSASSVMQQNPELMKMNNYASNMGTTPQVTALPNQGGSMFGGLFDNFFDTTNANGIKTQGWGGMGLSALQGIGNAYTGMKQFGLAEDTLKEQKRQFGLNYEAQRKTLNSQMSDRQRARVASNPGAYQSEAEYMKKWGI